MTTHEIVYASMPSKEHAEIWARAAVKVMGIELPARIRVKSSTAEFEFILKKADDPKQVTPD
ncbi:hypothetical protein NYE40_00700 [Paenibacillus sp. FSL W8-1187]|uniref:hypothetical protein n=1 Tax=Paenibacillus sp. FSL W8-1187 TaxID=2975339 RepID=UPI0030DBB977